MSHENDRRFAWDYETTYYHIYYAVTDLLDGVLDPLFNEAPRSAQNDADVKSHRGWIRRGDAAVEGQGLTA